MNQYTYKAFTQNRTNKVNKPRYNLSLLTIFAIFPLEVIHKKEAPAKDASSNYSVTTAVIPSDSEKRNSNPQLESK